MKLKTFSPQLILLLGACLLGASTSNACTRIFWNDNSQAKITARTFDLFTNDNPKMFVMPRGISRSGNVKDNPLTWTSKYGSVLINAFDSPTVSEGMNEQGLSAHLLYLHDTQYEKRDSTKPGLSNLLWAQYFLDNFKTVNEAVANADKFQVEATELLNKTWPIHLSLEDASGDSATIEYINGKMIIHHGPQYQVMANEPAYDKQLENLKRYKLFGGNLPMPGDIDSLDRFVRASSYLKTLPKPEDYRQAIAYLFSAIRSVQVPFGAVDTSGAEATDTWATRWSTVTDNTNLVYYFNSTVTPNIVWVDFKTFNFAEGAPTLRLDLTNNNLGGDVSNELKPKAS